MLKLSAIQAALGSEKTNHTATLNRLNREAEAAHAAYALLVSDCYEGLQKRAKASRQEVLAQDLAIAARVIIHPDFTEGVRAQLVDKDRRPQWSHTHVGQVSRSEVLSAFG